MSDAQPRTVDQANAVIRITGPNDEAPFTVSLDFIEQGVPVQNYQRRSWWGSYGYRAQHRKGQ